MAAERLRQAATVLRDRAEAATPGPWSVSGSGSYICADHPQVASCGRVVAQAETDWIDHESNAAYIALMAPPVALALADWLMDEAARADERSPYFFPLPVLDLADIILGTKP